MKKLLIFVFFSYISISHASECISDKEYRNVVEKIESIKEFYGKWPNIVSCNKKSELNHLVCNDERLKDAMYLLSMGNVYAYENATHEPLNDADYNNDYVNWLNDLIKRENNKEIALRKLCYIVKTKLSDDFGGDFYYSPQVHEVITSEINKNGVVIEDLNRIIYLGTSCDVKASTGSKGQWYKDGNQFVVELNGRKYTLNYDEKVFRLNCELSKSID